MDFMLEVRGLADATKRTATVNIVEPLVDLLVIFEREIDPPVGSFDDKTVGFELHAFYIGDIADFEHALLLRRL